MGIKGLNNLLNKVCNGSHISRVPISNYATKKIAIDASIYVCLFKTKPSYLDAFIEFILLLRENNIHPIFVFDGKYPIEKKQERENRAEKRRQQRARIEKIEQDLKEYQDTGQPSEFLQTLYDTKIIKPKLIIPKFHSKFVIDYVKKLKSYVNVITEEDYSSLKQLLDIFDIPHIKAEGEAEILCSSFQVHGMVDAVMTRDTDVLACLASKMITGIDGQYFIQVSLEEILSKLQLTKTSWVDMCIMCGTDFNKNIPRIGPVQAFELIKKFKTIEQLKETCADIDVDVLNYTRTRQIFSTGIKPEMTLPFSGFPNYQKLMKFLVSFELNTKIDDVKRRSKPVPLVLIN